jgi:hypothetical protein
MNPEPSIRMRCSGLAARSVSAGTGPTMSMSAGVIGSRVQDVKARAIRAHDLLAWNPQENPRVAQSTVAAIAGHGACVHMNDLGRCHRGSAMDDPVVEAALSGMMILHLV